MPTGSRRFCVGPRFAFRRHGESGLEIADILPFTARIADRICVIRSMQTDQINHDPAHTVMNTGTSISGRPSMGSWVLYGLGSETRDLPGFVVLTSVGGRDPQPIASRQWSAGFLPGRLQGVEFQSKGDPVHYVRSPAGVSLARIWNAPGVRSWSAHERQPPRHEAARVITDRAAELRQLARPDLLLTDKVQQRFVAP